jgi:RNA exonuclease 4
VTKKPNWKIKTEIARKFESSNDELLTPSSDDKSTTKYLALDCEMVGAEGGRSMLARVVILNSFGNVIYDKFAKPKEKVVDYRTWVSGIRPHHLKDGR